LAGVRAPQLVCPGVHRFEGFQRLAWRAAPHALAQRHPRPMQSLPDGCRLGLEHLGQLGNPEVLPVVELQEGLLGYRQLLERFDELGPFPVAVDEGAGRGHELRDRRLLEVDRGIALAFAEHAIELVPRDREQVRPEGRFFAKLVLGTQAGEERRLDELVRFGLALGLEEPRDAVEVALEQYLPRRLVTVTPPIDEYIVVSLGHWAAAYHGPRL